MPTDHRHQFPKVEDYLHHRDPYLMVDRVESVDESSIVTSVRISGNEYYLTGHFPGAPVVPGAMLQEMTTQTAGILIAARYNPLPHFDTHDPLANQQALGVLIRVNQARFRGFARPGDELTISVALVERVKDLFEFTGRVTRGDGLLMSNSFQLSNIPSSVLAG